MSSTSLHPLQKNNRNNNKKKPPQDDNDNNEDNHVRRLLREKASLERALAALCRQHRLAARERRGRRARYAHLVAKTELLGRVKKRNEIELYCWLKLLFFFLFLYILILRVFFWGRGIEGKGMMGVRKKLRFSSPPFLLPKYRILCLIPRELQ